LAALSFVVVFAAVLAIRLIAGRGVGTASSLLTVVASPQPLVSDVRPGEQPTQIGTLVVRNASGTPVVLSRAFLGEVTPGLGLVGFVVVYPGENDAALGGQCGPFPPPNFATHPLAGARLDPGTDAEIVVAVQATREGEFTLDGVRLFYDAGGKHFHQDLPLPATFRSRLANAACRFDPAPHQRSHTGSNVS
jgi:hypothetical protein